MGGYGVGEKTGATIIGAGIWVICSALFYPGFGLCACSFVACVAGRLKWMRKGPPLVRWFRLFYACAS